MGIGVKSFVGRSAASIRSYLDCGSSTALSDYLCKRCAPHNLHTELSTGRELQN